MYIVVRFCVRDIGLCTASCVLCGISRSIKMIICLISKQCNLVSTGTHQYGDEKPTIFGVI